MGRPIAADARSTGEPLTGDASDYTGDEIDLAAIPRTPLEPSRDMLRAWGEKIN